MIGTVLTGCTDIGTFTLLDRNRIAGSARKGKLTLHNINPYNIAGSTRIEKFALHPNVFEYLYQ